MLLLLQHDASDIALTVMAFSAALVMAALLVQILHTAGGRFGSAILPANRLTTLDGLRGILAFSVVVHHGCCWYFFINTGTWVTGRSILFARLAGFGVLQFFYISGFLFWRKLMRRGDIPLGRFYLSRFLRIGPTYYVCVAAAMLIAMAVAGFHLRTSPAGLLDSLLPWTFFSIGGRVPVNGSDPSRVIAGVVWTLALEWEFYLLLPFLGWYARRSYRLVFLALTFGATFMMARHFSSGPWSQGAVYRVFEEFRGISKFMLMGFGGGILIAVVEKHLKNWVKLGPRLASLLVLGCYATYLLVPGREVAVQVVLLAGFALVVLGADVFGLLASAPVRFLGVVSYSLYLVHGIVYFLVLREMAGLHSVRLPEYLPLALGCVVAVVPVAAVLHFTIERPSMFLSEAVMRGSKEAAPAERKPASPLAA